MAATFPFLTAYDPLGTSEGSLDPLGLYQIADQLAVQLVPAVRERMQRVRFLTAIAVGSLVTENLEGDSRYRDAEPYLVWEWLVIRSLTSEMVDDPSIWGVPGTSVTRVALRQHGYVDARSYLKTPRVFGFHGVYKALALRLGLVDSHLSPGPNAAPLADAWSRGLGFAGIKEAQSLLQGWTAAVRRSMNRAPPRTDPRWNSSGWKKLAKAFGPMAARAREKRFLRQLLLSSDFRQLGALSKLWRLLPEQEGDLREETLHVGLARCAPSYRPLVKAIQCYESFARGLQDAFDVLRADAARPDSRGYVVPNIARIEAFKESIRRIDRRFAASHRALGQVSSPNFSLQKLFEERFRSLAEPIDERGIAIVICELHEAVQRSKSSEGKRPWFDRVGRDRIYIRHAYRIDQPKIAPSRYLHRYRGWPINYFRNDLG